MLTFHQFNAKCNMSVFRWNMEFARGKNGHLWDNMGKKQLGLVVGITMYGTNHCDPAVTVAICKQKQTLIPRSNLYYVLEQAKLAAKILEISSFGKIFFSNLSAEEINMAIKKQLVLCSNRFRQKYPSRESATSVMVQVL